jgi:hypothetical protein
MSALSTNPYYIPSALEGNNWNESAQVNSGNFSNGARMVGAELQSSGNPWGYAFGSVAKQLGTDVDLKNYDPNPSALNNNYGMDQKATFDLGDERAAAGYMGSQKQFDQLVGMKGSANVTGRAVLESIKARMEMQKQLELARNRFNKSNIAFDQTNAAMNLQAARGI